MEWYYFKWCKYLVFSKAESILPHYVKKMMFKTATFSMFTCHLFIMKNFDYYLYLEQACVHYYFLNYFYYYYYFLKEKRNYHYYFKIYLVSTLFLSFINNQATASIHSLRILFLKTFVCILLFFTHLLFFILTINSSIHVFLINI